MYSPPHPFLSAKYKGSYAYLTVKDRMPIILTKVIDFLCREKKNLENSYGDVSSEEVKQIIGKLSKLRSEMQTNKPLLPLQIDPSDPEFQLWNSLYFQPTENGEDPRWFDSPWLLVECYMYRAINAAFQESSRLKTLDPFLHLKTEAYENSKGIIHSLAAFTMKSSLKANKAEEDVQEQFVKHIEAALWGNRNDLSVTGGDSESKYSQVLEDMHRLQSNILVNDTGKVWEYVRSLKSETSSNRGDLSIIMDNCGLELVADLCLAVFFLAHRFFNRVVFHVKKMPWFVSDVTVSDFHATLECMERDGPSELEHLAKQCLHHLSSGEFQVVEDSFWTCPLPYHIMNETNPELFKRLSASKLLIFKGDFNYRKLGADLDWPSTTDFCTFLQGFQPAPLLALRTIKAEIVCALPPGKAEELSALDKSWMAHGDYGLVQFANN